MTSPDILIRADMAGTLTRTVGEEPYAGRVLDHGQDSARLGASERAFAAAIEDASGTTQTTPVDAVTDGAGLRGIHGVTAAGDGEAAGDTILGGLLSVRGMFDDQIGRAAIFERHGSVTNVHDLIVAQAEVTKLSVMIDVTSKLAGKLVQSTDTLLKG